MAGWFLVSQPAVKQLLHGPGSLTKFIEADHARAAFEGVKNTPQNGQLVDVAGIGCQQANSLQPVASSLSGFFEKNVAQVVFFKVNFFNLTGRAASSWRNCAGKRLQRAGGSLGILN